MCPSDFDSGGLADGSDEGDALRLRAIAGCLGVPVAAFYAGTRSGDEADFAELLRLWQRLTTVENRTAALDAIRRLLDGGGGKT